MTLIIYDKIIHLLMSAQEVNIHVGIVFTDFEFETIYV